MRGASALAQLLLLLLLPALLYSAAAEQDTCPRGDAAFAGSLCGAVNATVLWVSGEFVFLFLECFVFFWISNPLGRVVFQPRPIPPNIIVINIMILKMCFICKFVDAGGPLAVLQNTSEPCGEHGRCSPCADADHPNAAFSHCECETGYEGGRCDRCAQGYKEQAEEPDPPPAQRRARAAGSATGPHAAETAVRPGHLPLVIRAVGPGMECAGAIDGTLVLAAIALGSVLLMCIAGVACCCRSRLQRRERERAEDARTQQHSTAMDPEAQLIINDGDGGNSGNGGKGRRNRGGPFPPGRRRGPMALSAASGGTRKGGAARFATNRDALDQMRRGKAKHAIRDPHRRGAAAAGVPAVWEIVGSAAAAGDTRDQNRDQNWDRNWDRNWDPERGGGDAPDLGAYFDEESLRSGSDHDERSWDRDRDRGGGSWREDSYSGGESWRAGGGDYDGYGTQSV
jgi:hypothetical protein